MDLHFKKVLIIGIDSFTGKHLKSYLKKYDFNIFGTVLKTMGNESNIFQCDIIKKNEIKSIIESIKPDYIINLAGISFVATENKELFYKVNVFAVENILESCLEIENYQPLKIVLASSATVYGNQEENILDEGMCPNPVNHYGFSKLAMEQVAKIYFNKLNIVITRPFNYTGIGQEEHFLIPKIVSHFRNDKEVIELGNLDVYREFNDIEYVCEIYKRLFEKEIKSEIVNISSNRLIALKDIVEMMNDIAGYKIKIEINDCFVRKNEIKFLSGSTEKLFNLMGKIEQKDIKMTLKEMYYD